MFINEVSGISIKIKPIIGRTTIPIYSKFPLNERKNNIIDIKRETIINAYNKERLIIKGSINIGYMEYICTSKAADHMNIISNLNFLLSKL
tara:strand:+ start:3250 stop:3522 length:273 start_codon:yes stop_codon:yes gene_type:complete